MAGAAARIVTLNAGSSSLKASLVEAGQARATRTVDWARRDRGSVLGELLDGLGVRVGEVAAVAHRVVHGGVRFSHHVVIDDDVLAGIAAASELAPLHNETALETIAIARERLPNVPHVACFDTAFHSGLPALATTEPIPWAWRALGIRRFGFHGLSVEWSTRRAAELLRRRVDELAIVVAHLGSGSSVTAVDGGRSAWSSMGYTPLDGIMMGTRPGAIDPGIVLAVARSGQRMDAISDALEHESGLAGVSGTTSDVRLLERDADGGDPAARLALDLYAARAAAGIAGAATWLPRVNALVFTGGIGEHSGPMRAAIVRRLAPVGIPAIGDDEPGEDRVVAPGPPAVLRVEAREDLVMAGAASALLGLPSDPA